MNTTDFLEIVTFLKDDDKYTKRLKELEEAEANLKAKLAIADTVDKAQKLQTAANKALVEAEVERTAYAEAHAARASDLEKQFADKQQLVDDKWEKLQEERERVSRLLSEQIINDFAIKADLEEAKKLKEEAVVQRQLAEELAAKTRAKLSKLKAVIEES